MLIALDVATKTGWAVFSSQRIQSGVHKFKGAHGQRFAQFHNWLTELKNNLQDGSDIILLYEEAVPHTMKSSQVFYGFRGVLLRWCEHHQVAYVPITPQAIKRSATGSPSAHKDDVINAMLKLGHNPHDDNEADALALLHYAIDKKPWEAAI